jgi:hypothetical protein
VKEMILINKDGIAILINCFLIISMILIWSISPLSSTQPESLDHEIFEISWSDDDDDEDDDDEDDDDESEKESKNQISSSFNIPMIKFSLYLLVFIVAINYSSYSKKES